MKNAALSLDVSWDSSAISYFSVIEVNVGIVCACTITLRPLLAHLIPGMSKMSYGKGGYYGPDRTAMNTKKSSRDTMTHADHGIFGLADLEVTKVLNASQEGLTSNAFFEPAQFAAHRLVGPRMSTQITGGTRLPTKIGSDRVPATHIKTRSGDIMVTRETTIKEETRPVSPTRPSPRLSEKDDMSWLTSTSKDMSEGSSGLD